MMVATDFKKLLPPRLAVEADTRPPYYLWVFDPTDGRVRLIHNGDRHPANALTHATMARDVVHPERTQGYAFPIKGGWRLTNDEHRKLEDPFIVRVVLAALNRESPPAPLPSIRYHGDPLQGHQSVDGAPPSFR